MPHIRQIILGPRILHFLGCRIEDEVDFRNLEANDFDLEPHGDEALQLDLKDFLVPARCSAKRLSQSSMLASALEEAQHRRRQLTELVALPASRMALSSIKIGTRWPRAKALMLSAICRI